MRRAANLAVDRVTLAAAPDMRPPPQTTDQYIPPSMPGFLDVHASPLGGPDLRRARRLVGDRRHRAILLIGGDPQSAQVASLVRRQLAAIGIAVSIRERSPEAFFTGALGRWNLSLLETWFDDYADPSKFINSLFGPRRSVVAQQLRVAPPVSGRPVILLRRSSRAQARRDRRRSSAYRRRTTGRRCRVRRLPAAARPCAPALFVSSGRPC